MTTVSAFLIKKEFVSFLQYMVVELGNLQNRTNQKPEIRKRWFPVPGYEKYQRNPTAKSGLKNTGLLKQSFEWSS